MDKCYNFSTMLIHLSGLHLSGQFQSRKKFSVEHKYYCVMQIFEPSYCKKILGLLQLLQLSPLL